MMHVRYELEMKIEESVLSAQFVKIKPYLHYCTRLTCDINTTTPHLKILTF